MLLQYVDTILSLRLATHLSTTLTAPPCFYDSAIAGSQTADIRFALRLAAETGLDCEGHVAMAQADIQAFYDHIQMTLILCWLLQQGIDIVTACAVVKLTVLPVVLLPAGSVLVDIAVRSMALENCNTVGRTPIADVIKTIHDDLQPLG